MDAPGAGLGGVTINVSGSLYGLSKDELLLTKQRRNASLGFV